MKSNRPVNLDMTTIKLPVMALASILHRVSAVVIWFAMAACLPMLYWSLASPEGFAHIQHLLTENIVVQFLAWGFLTALGYYSMGGIKHIIQEFGYFESLEGGRVISTVAIGSGLALSALFALWIWG